MQKILLIFTLIFSVHSFANLIVFPTRLVLNQKRPIGKLSLKYIGTTKMKFRIGTLYYKQLTNGKLIQAAPKEKIQDSASNLLTFSPRFVTLEPGETQVVRIMARRKGQLPKGEYRAHIHFESMKQANQDEKKTSKGIETNLVINMGVAVPVIYRYGAKSQKAIIENPKLQTIAGKKVVSFRLKKQSNSKGATYSKIEIYEENVNEPISTIKGISTYIDNVDFQFQLKEKFFKSKKYTIQLWDEENNQLTQKIPLKDL